MSYILIFMYIFGFKIYSIIDSTILVGLLLSIYLLINPKYRKNVFKYITSKYNIGIIILITMIIAWGMMTTVFNGGYDFSYIKTIIHFGLVIFIGLEIIGYFDYKGILNKILNYIIIAFLIQTFLQWLFYIFPNISAYFNPLRTESMIEKNVTYSGMRGLAIAGSGFFSLSSAYGLIFVLYFTKYNTLFKNYILKWIMFFVLLSGTFFAGRTGFVGLIFIPLLLMDYRKIKKKNLKHFFIVVILMICILLILVKLPITKKIQQLFSYAFEMFIKFFNGNGLQTSSTDKLLEMYNGTEMHGKTLIIGDGIYTESDGSYYKNVDIGYYRKFLYFGGIGLIFSLILEYYLLTNSTRKERIVLMLFFMVLELKGEIIGLNILVNSIIILYTFMILNENGVKKSGKVNSFIDNI